MTRIARARMARAQPLKFSNDEFEHEQWALRKLNAPGAWARIRAQAQKQVLVAVVDTGVADHEDLPKPIQFARYEPMPDNVAAKLAR